jgi:hypothetical protein
MYPRKYGEKTTTTLEGGDKPTTDAFDVSSLPDNLVATVAELLPKIK